MRSRGRRRPHALLQRSPLLIAHRGGAGLKPENTLAAFTDAVTLWNADMIELDVRATRDGHCVVIHDATVDRTTDGTGAVAEMSLSQIQEFDAGYAFTPDGGITFPMRNAGIRVPLFEDVLATLSHDFPITVELKTADAQAPVLETIRRFNAANRIVLAGERDAYRTRIREHTGPISASREQGMPFYVLHRLWLSSLARLEADVVQMCEYLGQHRMLSPRLVKDLTRRNVPIHVWTVNETADMHRLLDWGVHGIITDFPDRLARVLHERTSRPLPPGLTR